MRMAIIMALCSSLGFGLALVSSRIGLRTLDARTGAAISIPSATVLFVLALPLAWDSAGFSWQALFWFAGVGLFFPAVVTLLTFRSNEKLGPTLTGAVSGTSPLFALLAAALFLGEAVPAQAALASLLILAGITLLSWQPKSAARRFAGGSLAWPALGAMLRGLCQVAAKAGLLLWPNPFAAGLIGYLVSSVVVLGTRTTGIAYPSKLNRQGLLWFVLTGVLNGGAVLLMYGALSGAPVAVVAPIVASYPLVTALVSALVLREERVTLRMLLGTTLTVGAIVWLLA
jgi:drug/metabolite transporter (DMT)-like permease